MKLRLVTRGLNIIKVKVGEWLVVLFAALLPIRQVKMKDIPPIFTEKTIQNMVTILVPHPDDEVIGCFHFIERYGSYFPIELIYITDMIKKDIAKIRRIESAEATKNLHIAQRIWWGFPDGNLSAYRKELSQRLADLPKQYQYILCPALGDRTPDHAILAEEAYATIPVEQLLWYRSTWWTFPLYAADFMVQGKARKKREALRHFKSQRRLALQNVVTMSGLEAGRCGLRGGSVEAFRFASSGALSDPPINILSFKALWQLMAIRD